MRQSAFLTFAILFGFVVFVTLKGELPQYIAVFIGKADNGTGGTGFAGLPSLATMANKLLPVGGVNGTGVGTLAPNTPALPGITTAPTTFGGGEPMLSP